MSNTKRKTVTIWRVFGLAFALFCGWFAFSWTEPIHHTETLLNGILPSWLVAVNLFLAPCLVAVVAGGTFIPLPIRLTLGAIMFFSVVILEVTFRRFLLASCGVLTIVLVEVYWIIPKWYAKRSTNLQTNADGTR